MTNSSFVRPLNRTPALPVLPNRASAISAAAIIPAEGGSVINIGSVVGQMANAGASIYAATKGAVNSITVSLSKELGPRKIRVNALNPGLVETEGVQSAGFLGSPFEQEVVKITPLGRIGQPADIGKVAVFLASDDSFWVNGELLNVGGGVTM